jgi:hypothetical protein
MQIKVYQIDHDKDKDRVRFENLENAIKYPSGVNPAIYAEVFSGDVDCNNLEDVFRIFNLGSPLTHRGTSMSMSDIVEVCGKAPTLVGTIDYLNTDGKVGETVEYTDSAKYNADIAHSVECGRPFEAHNLDGKNVLSIENGCYYCDNIGFEKIKFDTTLTSKPKNLLHAVMVEPGKIPYETEIANELKSLQKAVGGGLIEITYPFDDNAVIVSNEEAKLLAMDGNRKINDEIYAGPLFIIGDNGRGDNCSLTDEQIAKYSEMFKTPEHYTTEEVEDSIYMEFHTL